MIQYTSRQSWQIPCHIPGPVMISSIFCFNHHLVGGFNPTPLKNDGLRHLGWWHSQLNVIITRGYFLKEYPHELLGEFPIKITMNQLWNSHVPTHQLPWLHHGTAAKSPRSGTCSATARTRHPGAGANPPCPSDPRWSQGEPYRNSFFFLENGGLPSGKPT